MRVAEKPWSRRVHYSSTIVLEVTTERSTEGTKCHRGDIKWDLLAAGVMDYSYLNQAAAAAAAGFEASSCALAAGEMQCSYGDLSSCSQMSQAAYRYTAARAAGYPGNAAAAAAGAAAGGTPLTAHHTAHSHTHAHHGAHSTPCSVMAARSQEVHRHAASIFPSAINLQSE